MKHIKKERNPSKQYEKKQLQKTIHQNNSLGRRGLNGIMFEHVLSCNPFPSVGALECIL